MILCVLSKPRGMSGIDDYIYWHKVSNALASRRFRSGLRRAPYMASHLENSLLANLYWTQMTAKPQERVKQAWWYVYLGCRRGAWQSARL